MGGLKKFMSITHLTFLIGCLAIAGMPPFSGFFSKDEILAAAFAKNPVYWIVGVLTAFMTAFYMFRLYGMTFLGKFRGTNDQEHHLHESPFAITIPLIILAILAVVGGWIGIPEVFMQGGHHLETFLEPIFEQSNKLVAANNLQHQLSHSTEYTLMALSVTGALVALVYAWIKFSKYQKSTNPETGINNVLVNKWYVDEIYEALIVKPMHAIANFLNTAIEKRSIDGLVNGVGKAVNYSSRQMRLLQTGQVSAYMLMMVVAILLLFIIQLFL